MISYFGMRLFRWTFKNKVSNAEFFCFSKEKNDIWIIKSRNISDDGSDIHHIENYDQYMDNKKAASLSVNEFINRYGIDAVMNQIDLDTIATIGKVAAATLSSGK